MSCRIQQKQHFKRQKKSSVTPSTQAGADILKGTNRPHEQNKDIPSSFDGPAVVGTYVFVYKLTYV